VSAQARPPMRLEISGLSVRFGGVRAVDDLTLSHDTGGVVGLIGPNGAGKTTVLNVLSGVVRPTKGRVTVDGRRVDGRRPDRVSRAGVARTYQNLQTFGSLSVLDNVLVPLEARDWLTPAARLKIRARNVLAHVGLTELLDVPVAELPYGTQRRVEIARAVVARPRLLLLDEPLAGLSRAESDELSAVIRKVAQGGATVLLVEHDVFAVMQISDRVVVLDQGALLADDRPAEVQADERVRAAYLGEELSR
jgi:branched-chain amino acid transport system ATP-binding protein